MPIPLRADFERRWRGFARGAAIEGRPAGAAAFVFGGDLREAATRTEAAKIGGVDAPDVRDWVHAFNARGRRA